MRGRNQQNYLLSASNRSAASSSDMASILFWSSFLELERGFSLLSRSAFGRSSILQMASRVSQRKEWVSPLINFPMVFLLKPAFSEICAGFKRLYAISAARFRLRRSQLSSSPMLAVPFPPVCAEGFAMLAHPARLSASFCDADCNTHSPERRSTEFLGRVAA